MDRPPAHEIAKLLALALAVTLASAGCGGGADPDEEIEQATRAAFGAAAVFNDETPARDEVVAARDAFCEAVVVYTGDPKTAAATLRAARVPPRPICRSGFESGETGKTLAFTNFASIVRIERKGDQAEVRFRADVPAEPEKTYATAALVTRRDGRWRVVLPCAVIGCDASLLPARQAQRPRPKVLDEVRGRYRGTSFGDRGSAALRRQGRPPKGRKSDESGPIGSDFYEDGGPSSWSPPGRSSVTPGDLNYRGRAYLVADGRGDPPVYGFIVTDRRAQTLRGVGIGDTLAFARRRYPQLRCDIVNQGTEYVTFPACRARLAPRRYLGFGQNPIRTIVLMTVPFDGAR